MGLRATGKALLKGAMARKMALAGAREELR